MTKHTPDHYSFAMAHRSGLILVLVTTIFASCLCNGAYAWGANVKERRPATAFVSRFPASPSVVVQAGGSFEKAKKDCNEKLGKGAYCTIQLNGVPADINNDENGLRIDRSCTMLSASGGFELRRIGNGAFISVPSNVKFVAVENMLIRGHSAQDLFGIQVFGGNIKHLVIRNCEIYNFDAKWGAHGISVYGSRASGVQHVSIENNFVHDMKTGWSESIAVNGFVRRWAITNNRVFDVNNIAIDAIGGEGTYPPHKRSGRILPHPKDAASFGIIEKNQVKRMSLVSNPRYGNKHDWAAAIYVDGATNIIIRGNTVEESEWAYEIGAENCVTSKNIEISDNSAIRSYFGDFVAGGYRRTGFKQSRKIGCNPKSTKDQNEGHGYVERISVFDNDFNTVNGQEDNVLVQFRTTYAIIKQDGVEPVNANGKGSARGDKNAIRTS